MAPGAGIRREHRNTMKSILKIDNLTVSFTSGKKGRNFVQALHGVSFKVKKGEILGLVGESGSGKSLSCLAAMRLLPKNAQADGTIRFMEKDLLHLSEAKMSAIRGKDLAMIFQDPMGALNPVQTIEKQMIEALKNNTEGHLSRKKARNKAIELLSEVGLPDPKDRLKKYPHELSGGQNQRVMIAMMLAGNPKLLIADEPTTALDVTIQAQILRLLKRLRKERDMAIVLVTHDLGVVAETCNKVAVMYCGRIVESGSVKKIFANPRHPYTRGLLASRPRIDQENKDLTPIPGVVPTPLELPDGCAFSPRCKEAIARCLIGPPEMVEQDIDQVFACCNPPSAPDISEAHP